MIPVGIVRSLCIRASEITGIPVVEMIARNNTRAVSTPRHAVVYLARNQHGYGLKRIGRCLGDRHHSTILLSYRRAVKRRAADSSFAALLEEMAL